MLLLLKNVRIIDGKKESRPQDILIRDGAIELSAKILRLKKGADIWEMPGASVSVGWLDVGVQVCDPGYEHREDLHSAARAAGAGGFTAVACFPNTNPALHSKSEILYVKNKTKHSLVTFHPIGAVSQSCEGKDLAELFDMHSAGAVAFSDGKKAVQDAGLLLRAMQYAKGFNGLVINEPHHKTIAAGGQMHEGTVSTSLGLKAIPALAEEVMVQRDLSLLEYAESRLHIHLLSSAKSVELVRKAKSWASGHGLCRSCQPLFHRRKLSDFDSNWKLMPPLRSQSDIDALLEGVTDGTIDFICSNHTPWDEEAKNLEFPYADFGMIGLETAFALCRTFLSKKLSVSDIVEKIAIAPRRALGLPIPEIKPGVRAEITVFDPDADWTFSEKEIRSKSHNTPFVGHALKGKVLGIVNNGQAVRNA